MHPFHADPAPLSGLHPFRAGTARVLWLSLFLLALGAPAAALAGDLKLRATLIWGTDMADQTDPKIKKVDAKMAEKLCGIFKWKHYFEVERQQASLVENATKRLKMSDKCEVEVLNQGKSGFEAKLFGEGKLCRTYKGVIPVGEHLVLAGDEKNLTAWFVVITPE